MSKACKITVFGHRIILGKCSYREPVLTKNDKKKFKIFNNKYVDKMKLPKKFKPPHTFFFTGLASWPMTFIYRNGTV